jgi:hypothetical protein
MDEATDQEPTRVVAGGSAGANNAAADRSRTRAFVRGSMPVGSDREGVPIVPAFMFAPASDPARPATNGRPTSNLPVVPGRAENAAEASDTAANAGGRGNTPSRAPAESATVLLPVVEERPTGRSPFGKRRGKRR